MTKDLLKSKIIAPMATAVWLIDNTSLSFKQIGDFCDFTEAEVKLMADGVIGKGVFPADPTRNGNLTKEEIFRCEQDGGELHNAFKSLDGLDIDVKKKRNYIPMLQRRSRPNAVLWLVNYCPELSDAQIIKLVRTTKNMIQMIRNRSYAEYNDLVAKDPVILGFCTQRDLDKAVEVAKSKIAKLEEKEMDNAKTKAKRVIRKINVNKIKVRNEKTISVKTDAQKAKNGSKKNIKALKEDKTKLEFKTKKVANIKSRGIRKKDQKVAVSNKKLTERSNEKENMTSKKVLKEKVSIDDKNK